MKGRFAPKKNQFSLWWLAAPLLVIIAAAAVMSFTGGGKPEVKTTAEAVVVSLPTNLTFKLPDGTLLPCSLYEGNPSFVEHDCVGRATVSTSNGVEVVMRLAPGVQRIATFDPAGVGRVRVQPESGSSIVVPDP